MTVAQQHGMQASKELTGALGTPYHIVLWGLGGVLQVSRKVWLQKETHDPCLSHRKHD